jgi:hypothetical protein
MTDPKQFEYQIGDKTYIQKPLVLGQIRQLTNLLQGVTIPGNATPLTLVGILDDKLPMAIAIVIIPPLPRGDERGVMDALKNKDIESLSSQIEFEISPETTLQVIENFFVCNPIASLLERLTGTIKNISGKIMEIKSTRLAIEIGLKNLSASSPKETSQNGTPSSGDIPQKSASPTSSIAAET